MNHRPEPKWPSQAVSLGQRREGGLGNIFKPDLCRTGGRPRELDVESEDTER